MATLTGSTFVLPPEGKVTITLREIKETPNRFYKEGDDEEKRTRLQWLFDVDGLEGAELSKFSSKRLTTYEGKKSNALQLSEALMGRPLTEDELRELDTDNFIGKKLSVMIGYEVKEDKKFAKILSFNPVR